MKKLIAVLIIAAVAQSVYSQKKVKLKNQVDSLSYAIGVSIYEGAAGLNSELDYKVIAAAMKATEEEREVMDAEAAKEYIMEFSRMAAEKEMAENREVGEKFLEDNSKKEGVIVTESGLQYTVITQGEGEIPGPNDRVKVDYTGYLIDGTKFDSSIDRGEPAEFGVGQVISGWTEILQLMPAGSEYNVVIPAELAYGERGAGSQIGPGSVLIFDIKLLDVLK